MNTLNTAEYLSLATTALVDLHKGYPHKEIGGATGQGLPHLITELVAHQRAQGINDDGAWDCEVTQDIPVVPGKSALVSVEQFLDLVQAAGALYVADSPLLMEVEVFPLIGEPDNEVLFAQWESEGLEYSVKVTEEGLGKVQYDAANGAYLVNDEDGDEVAIKLFHLVPMVPVV